ncbi:MAG: hypothetical protein IJO02_04595, partial [Clostridia bacterium]|nr:hypothetical protein [Clostridia bacterium]
SRNTLFGKSCLSCWHTVVFPTPIVPPIIYKVFIIHTYKFQFITRFYTIAIWSNTQEPAQQKSRAYARLLLAYA